VELGGVNNLLTLLPINRFYLFGIFKV
jgi:hypothetical protein